jgi:hypothetical protein
VYVDKEGEFFGIVNILRFQREEQERKGTALRIK